MQSSFLRGCVMVPAIYGGASADVPVYRWGEVEGKSHAEILPYESRLRAFVMWSWSQQQQGTTRHLQQTKVVFSCFAWLRLQACVFFCFC